MAKRSLLSERPSYKGPPWHSCEDLVSEARIRFPASLEIQDKMHFFRAGVAETV